MKANTAITFILAGTALWFASHKKPERIHWLVAQICNSLFFLISLLTLGEYIFRRDFGIDQLLFQDLQTPPLFFPARTSFASSLCFILTGISLFMLINGRAERITLLSQYIAAVPLFISPLALVGYVYDVQALYHLASYSTMSLNTAVAFLLYALGLLCLRPDQGWMRLISTETAGGAILRRLLPSVLGLPLVLGWLILAGDRAGFYETHFGLALLSVSIVFVLMITLWLNSKRLNRVDADRQQVKEALMEIGRG